MPIDIVKNSTPEEQLAELEAKKNPTALERVTMGPLRQGAASRKK